MDTLATEYRNQLDSTLEEIADVNRRLDRLYDVIETGKLSLDNLAQRIRQLKERKEQLQTRKWELEWQLKDRKVEIADSETVANYVEDLRNLLNESSLAEGKSFIKSFVKEIAVTGDETVLTYTIPLTAENLKEEKLGIPHIVRSGGPLWTRTTDPGLIRTVL